MDGQIWPRQSPRYAYNAMRMRRGVKITDSPLPLNGHSHNEWIADITDVFDMTVDVVTLEKLDKAFSAIQDAGEMHGMIGVSDVVNFLVNVYDPLTDNTGTLHNVNVPLTVDLILNWLLNVYDRYDSPAVVFQL